MDVARENVLAGWVRFDAPGRPDPPAFWRASRRRDADSGGGMVRASRRVPVRHILLWARPGYAGDAGQLAFLAGVAVADTLQSLCQLSPDASQNAPRIGLKWPNDVLLNGKKVGGILIELAEPKPQEWTALIGVGVNISIREFPPDLEDKATSLLREGITPIGYETFGMDSSRAERVRRRAPKRRVCIVLNHWRRYDETPGHVYETLWHGKTVRGVAQGIDAEGALRLRLEDDRVISVVSASTTMETP